MICSRSLQLYTCVIQQPSCVATAYSHLRLQIGNLSFYTTEEQIYEVFLKCASPEDGGGIKRIIMGLDRNTRSVSFNAVHGLKLTGLQNTLRLLLRGILYPLRGIGQYAICQWNQVGRTYNSMRFGPGIQRRPAIRTREKWRSGP